MSSANNNNNNNNTNTGKLTSDDIAVANSVGLSITEAERLSAYHSLDNFIKLHRQKFQSMQLPEILWPRVHQKIYNEIFDAAETFQIADIEEEDDDGNVTINRQLIIKDEDLKANADVWLIYHQVTFTPEAGIRVLRETEGLVDRLYDMMDLVRIIEEEAKNSTTNNNSNNNNTANNNPDYTSDESVSLVMQQSNCSRDEAIAALTDNRGSLIDAINQCNDKTSTATNTNRATVQQELTQSMSQLSTSDNKTNEQNLSENDKKAKLVWDYLFKLNYVGVYYTMKPRETNDRGAVRADEVQTNYYINDEIGSAVRSDYKSSAQLMPFVCVTLADAYSLLWTVKDLKEGDEVSKPIRPPVRKPCEFTV